MMENVQRKASELWHDFLEPDLGFSRDHLQVTFSGHRGFHLHVRDPAMWHLDAAARRELVNWIRGEGLKVSDRLLQQTMANADVLGDGWDRRLAGALKELTDRAGAGLQDAEERAAHRRELIELGKGKGKGIVARRIDSLLERFDALDQPMRERVRGGMFDSLGGTNSSPNQHVETLMKLLKESSAIQLGTAGETDEVVTVDVRRIIRWPTGLHGKTGMRVTELPLERLAPDRGEAFDATTEALALRGSTRYEVEVTVPEACVTLRGREFELAAGQRLEVDEAEAAFLLLKGWAQAPKRGVTAPAAAQ